MKQQYTTFKEAISVKQKLCFFKVSTSPIFYNKSNEHTRPLNFY